MIKKSLCFFLFVAFVVVFMSGCIPKRSASQSQTTVPSGILKDYNVVIVRDFVVPDNVAAPDTAGSQIAEKIVFQVRRYSQKYNLFEKIVKAGTKDIPAGKKVLLVKGEVYEYTQSSVGKRVGRSFIPGGGYTGTAAFGAHYKFIDQKSGKLVYKTDLRSTSTGSADTVDYAMERNAEAAAKVIYQQKTGK